MKKSNTSKLEVPAVRGRVVGVNVYRGFAKLCDLAEKRKGIKNCHMAVKEWNGEIIFLRKLANGGTNRSYGVVVAGMAGLPPTVIKRAKDVLKLLEVKDLRISFAGKEVVHGINFSIDADSTLMPYVDHYFEYDTDTFPIISHGAYFDGMRFFERLGARVEAILKP